MKQFIKTTIREFLNENKMINTPKILLNLKDKYDFTFKHTET